MAMDTPIDEHLEKAVLQNPVSEAVSKATKSKTGKMLGGLLFMIGFLVAVAVGLVNGLVAAGILKNTWIDPSIAAGAMAVVGLIVGLVNISDKEAVNFLIGAIAITVASAAIGNIAAVGKGTLIGNATAFLATFIGNMAVVIGSFAGPAALVVGLKVVYVSARKS